MPKKKPFVLRLDPETMKAVEKWAADEFRSSNGQLEWIVNRALKEVGRQPKKKAEEIVDKFNISYSFKTTEAAELSRERNLLFHDFHYHSVYRNNKKYIEIDSSESKKMNHLKPKLYTSLID